MRSKDIPSLIISGLTDFFLGIKENTGRDLGNPKKFLVIRQHNQFGDMLASVSLFRAIKETYPGAVVNVLVSPSNYYGVTKNIYIDRYFIFDKNKLFNPSYFKKLSGFLKNNYDVCIIPSTVSLSFTSLLLGRLSDAKTRIGPASLNGVKNKYAYLVDRRVELNWLNYPDAHVSDFGLDIVRPFGIRTRDYTSNVTFDEHDLKFARGLIMELNPENKKLIGIHVGAGKPHNRWSVSKFIELIEKIKNDYKAEIYITGSSSDKQEIDYLKKNTRIKLHFVINQTIPRLAALISESDLFITNDTGVMHVAGTTETKQISIFGPTNPFNWAPLGNNKYFIKKSDLIEDVSVNDVYNLVQLLLDGENSNDEQEE